MSGSGIAFQAGSLRSRRGREESPSAGRAFFEQQASVLAAAESDKRRRRSQSQRDSGSSTDGGPVSGNAVTDGGPASGNVVAEGAASEESAADKTPGILLHTVNRTGNDPHTLLSEALEFRMGFQAALLLETDPVIRQELDEKLNQASEIYAQRLREASAALPPQGHASQIGTQVGSTLGSTQGLGPHLLVSADQIRAFVKEIVNERVPDSVHSKGFLSTLRAIDFGPRAFDGGVTNEDGKIFTLLKPDNNVIELVASSLCAWRMVLPARAEQLGDLGGLKISLKAVSKLAARALAFGRNHQPFRNLEDRSLTVAYEFRQAHLWSCNTAGEFPVLLQFFLGEFRFDRTLFASDGSIDIAAGLNVFSAYVGTLPSASRQVDKSFVLSVINSWSDAFTCLCGSPVSSTPDASFLSWKAVFEDFAWRVRAADLQHGQPGFILDALAASLESWFSTITSPFFLDLQRYAFTSQLSAIWLLNDILGLVNMDSTRIEVWRARCLEIPRAALVCCHDDACPKIFSSNPSKPGRSTSYVCIAHLVQDVLGLAVPSSFKFSCPGLHLCGRRHLDPSELGAEKDYLDRIVNAVLSKELTFRSEVLAKIASLST